MSLTEIKTLKAGYSINTRPDRCGCTMYLVAHHFEGAVIGVDYSGSAMSIIQDFTELTDLGETPVTFRANDDRRPDMMEGHSTSYSFVETDLEPCIRQIVEAHAARALGPDVNLEEFTDDIEAEITTLVVNIKARYFERQQMKVVELLNGDMAPSILAAALGSFVQGGTKGNGLEVIMFG